MANFNKYPHVFSPIQVGTMTLKNRIQFSPMICALETPTGEITQEYIDWIAQQARTGASLITIGGTSIDHETGDDFESEIDVTTDVNVVGLKRLADEAHYRGAKISIELVHAGRGAMPRLLKDGVAISSSVFPATGGPEGVGNTHIREMTYWKWDVETTKKCGAKVLLGTEATPELVMAEEPDAIFIAVGSSPIVPPIPGIERTAGILDVDNDRVELGKKVVVCGGGLSGTECALELAYKGHDVTVVDMLPVQAFAKDAAPAPYTMLHALLKENNVKLIGDSKVLSISDKGVEIIDRDLRHQFLEADTVVNALGMRANKEIVDRFAGLIPEVYVIGDAAGGGNMRHATASAFIPAVEC